MLGYSQDNLEINYLAASNSSQIVTEGEDVTKGLTQTPKSLPPRYFYDEGGSQLFEQICNLPEYYPTRTEAAILQEHACEIARLTKGCELIELGSGSSTKTRILLDAYQNLNYPVHYFPVDVSGSILESSAKQLLQDYPLLKIQGLVGTYELALERLRQKRLYRRVICFLGSTLGNFEEREYDQFFTQLSAALNPGDFFLLGVDLQKDTEVLEAAYNDSQGVTAAFNLNILAHLNRRFQGDFNLDLFAHRAIYAAGRSQIEMYLIAQKQQTVTLKALDLKVNFAPQEAILTEISHKFNPEQLISYLSRHNLKKVGLYQDKQAWFALILCQFLP